MKTVSIRVFACLLAGVLLGSCGGGGGNAGTGTIAPATPAYDGSGLGLQVGMEDGSIIGVWPGDVDTRTVLLTKNSSDIRTNVTIQTGNAAVQLVQSGDDYALKIDARTLTPGARVDATLVATNLDNGLTTSLPLSVKVVTPATVASGTLPVTGGAVAGAGGAVGLQVAGGQLSAPLGVTIQTAPLPSGAIRVRMLFDRDVSTETAAVTLMSNQLALPAAMSSRSSLMAGPASSEHMRAQAVSTPPYPLDTERIQSFPGWFLPSDAGGYRLASPTMSLAKLSKWGCAGQAVTQTAPLCAELDPTAAVLDSSKTSAQLSTLKDAQSAGGKKLVPVLFIHGFQPDPLGYKFGGGAGTWNDFPKLVADLSGPEREYIPFEFRWRTNASLTVVADDLANALRKIEQLTGQPVRIVAHSFGGLLVRTLLEGLAATQTTFDSAYVHSVLTLGTPHSGILADAKMVDGQSLPDGRFSGIISFCDQISCFQAGEGRLQRLGYDDIQLLTGSGASVGGLVAKLATGRLPTGLPFVVGIGQKAPAAIAGVALVGEGDGLISLRGQRYNPITTSTDSLLECSGAGGGLVKEVALNVVPGSTAGLGYSHIGPLAIISDLLHVPSLGQYFPASTIEPIPGREVGEPHVVCSAVSGCGHASFLLFLAIQNAPATYCDTRTPPPSPTDSLIGSSVTLTEDSPALGSHMTIANTQTVRAGAEYATGSLQRATDSVNVASANVDLSSSAILITYTQPFATASAAFNGLVFTFDTSSPRITGATLDPQSSFTSSQVGIGFGDHQVTVNVPGVSIATGSRILVQLSLDSAAPTVSGVNCVNAVVGQVMTCTVSGSHLPLSELNLASPACAAFEIATGGSSESRSFSCVPSVAGASVIRVVRSASGTSLWDQVLSIAPAVAHNVTFADEFTDATLDTSRWTVTTSSAPCCGTGNPTAYSESGGFLNITNPGGSCGSCGVPDGSTFAPTVSPLAGDFEVYLSFQELVRTSRDGTGPMNAVTLDLANGNTNAGVYVVGDVINNLGTPGHAIYVYAGGTVLSAGTRTLTAGQYYSLEFRVRRVSAVLSLGYRVAGDANWTETAYSGNSASLAMRPSFTVSAGDAHGTRVNSSSSIRVDRFTITQ